MGAITQPVNLAGLATSTAQDAASQGQGLAGKATNEVNKNGGLLGLPGAGPQAANIQQGTGIGDVQQAQQGAQNSLQSQNALLQALQNQNGLGMQSGAANMQQGLANQLGSANGVGVQQGAISGLQNTAGLYQNIANGQGPNPAQAMLNQATGANVANQAALMAGQRGAGANVGLLARQAAQQGAATQQQAAGQGATMQANQQINALAGLTGAQQAIGGLGSGLTNQQTAANQAYANQANQIAGQQISQQAANTQAALANQQQMQNALQGVNNANVATQGSVNTGNVGLSQSNAAAKQAVIGGVTNSLGPLASSLGGKTPVGARGGMVHMADGGPVSGPQSSFGQYLANPSNNIQDSNAMLQNNSEPQKATAAPAEKKNDMTSDLMKVAPLLLAKGGSLAKSGGHVKAKTEAQKPVEKGNSYSNDKVPAMLSAGEIVIPRSITQSKDPGAAAAKFVSQVLAKRKVK